MVAEPVRTCVGCRQQDASGAMVRCVLDGSLVVPDLSRTAPGRGAWLHPRQTCLTAARRGGFARSFRRAVHVSDDLAAVIETC